MLYRKDAEEENEVEEKHVKRSACEKTSAWYEEMYVKRKGYACRKSA